LEDDPLDKGERAGPGVEHDEAKGNETVGTDAFGQDGVPVDLGQTHSVNGHRE
jgi:hypothetical protein